MNVGDKVRVVCTTSVNDRWVGQTGTICQIDTSTHWYPILVDLERAGLVHFEAAELEPLITNVDLWR